MAWLQIHQSLVNHRKTIKLARALGVPRPQVIGHLVLLWLWALDNAPDGHLEDDAETIAEVAMWPDDPAAFVQALVSVRLLDPVDDGHDIHDWQDYAGKLIARRERNTERMRAVRNTDSTGDPARRRSVRNTCNAQHAHVRPVCEARVEKSRVEKSRYTLATLVAADTPPNARATAPPPQKADTQTRELFDALVAVCLYDPQRLTRNERGELNAAVRALREAHYGPPDVATMAGNWASHFEQCAMTPSALAKHASRLMRRGERHDAGRGSAGSDGALAAKYAGFGERTVRDLPGPSPGVG